MSSSSLNVLHPVQQSAFVLAHKSCWLHCAMDWLVIKLHGVHQHLRLNAATTCSARRDCRRDCRSRCRSHCESTPCSQPLFPRVHWPSGTRTDTHEKCPVIRANNVRQTPTRMPRHRLHDMFCAAEITITALNMRTRLTVSFATAFLTH